MRLGELLLQENVITPEALEEALESQVVHGGRLGTNLVELGLLSEQELARLLGKQHNVASASGEMVPDPRALELVDINEADEKDYLPMRVDATRMSVAVINPQDLETLDALAFRTGKRVVPVVIPEFRMNQLQRRYCKAFRAMRAIDMNAVRPSRAQQEAQKAAAAEQSPDLISEEEFQSLYARALTGGGAPPGAEPVLDLVEMVEDEAPAPIVEGYVTEAPVELPPLEVPELLPEALVLEEAPPPVAPPKPPPPVPAPPPVASVRPRAPVVAPEPPPTPLTFAEAQAELGRSLDREQVATTVLRFALGKWKRSLLLSVQGNLVTGWRGMGQGVREAAVKRIGIGLQAPSTFRLVRDTRSHYVGPVRRDAASGLFYKLLGGDYPTTAVILPLLVRGKLVHLLYVDNGPGQLTPPDVGELLILSQGVNRSYEAMIRRRKSA
ncbi:type II secretion system (T2SS) protein E [Archangium gephyra]|uniref:Type II secretion system (T2SS) protein E n=1 Tax=Archangium gephyra TaxID=48 RepID=A0AAC8TFS5_9BACT|nr:general secretion pathway protein GspE [Archangium gephyra]AKJ02851.1 Type II secretory pathway, ATPase PulE/Tfp pilus assembly pathway, ATPase PilB [Archangium gephyra]REG24977.1 type II secretion system (T2SS) protein E [Archangium gephyra]